MAGILGHRGQAWCERLGGIGAGLANVEFVKGHIEAIPLPDASVDTRAQFEASLTRAGLVEIDIREAHRVHTHAAAAIVRAVMAQLGS